MAVTTITFSVQLGSDGYALARAVAERLGYRYLDWEITSQAAAEAGVSPDAVAAQEQSRSAMTRFVDRLFSGSAYASDVGYVASPEAVVMSAAIGSLISGGYRLFVESVVRQVALRGEAVIVGHAGQIILQNEPDVLKVLVHGSPAVRAKRLVAEDGLSLTAAERSIQKSDRERKDFFKQAYGVDLLDPRLYDLTVNTDHLEIDAIVQSIVSFAKRPPTALAAPAPGPPATAAKPVRAGATRRGVPKTRQEDALHRALLSLEQTMAADPDEEQGWAQRAGDSLAVLRRVFNRHAREAEGPSGSLNEIIAIKPRLARRVSQVIGEHETIRQQIDDFAAEIALQATKEKLSPEQLRELATKLKVTLRLHEAKGADLLHEAFSRDDGGG